MLRILGRRRNVEDSIKAIENLRNAGCKYINMDLMYMIPGQTLEEWIKDLEIDSQQDVDEITCYPTLVTSYSIGYKLIKRGKYRANLAIVPLRKWFMHVKIYFLLRASKVLKYMVIAE